MKHCSLFVGIILCLLYACNNSHKEDKQQAETVDSTSFLKKQYDPYEDSIGKQELRGIIADFEKSTKDTFAVDSVIYRGKDSVRVLYKHYADHHNLIVIPDRFTEMYGLHKYTAPEFIASLKMIRNGIVIIDTSYGKKMFIDYVPQEWREFSILMHPHLYIEEKEVRINYSISIPLTDLGRSASLTVDYNGYLEKQAGENTGL